MIEKGKGNIAIKSRPQGGKKDVRNCRTNKKENRALLGKKARGRLLGFGKKAIDRAKKVF